LFIMRSSPRVVCQTVAQETSCGPARRAVSADLREQWG
jgi:hypothetical protein